MSGSAISRSSVSPEAIFAATKAISDIIYPLKSFASGSRTGISSNIRRPRFEVNERRLFYHSFVNSKTKVCGGQGAFGEEIAELRGGTGKVLYGSGIRIGFASIYWRCIESESKMDAEVSRDESSCGEDDGSSSSVGQGVRGSRLRPKH
jgi:hypothetical protein